MPIPPISVDELKREIGDLHLSVLQRDRYIAQLETRIAMLESGVRNEPRVFDVSQDLAATASGT